MEKNEKSYTDLVQGSLNFLRALSVEGFCNCTEFNHSGKKSWEMTVRIFPSPLFFYVSEFQAWWGSNITFKGKCEGEAYNGDGEFQARITDFYMSAMLPFGAKGKNPIVGWSIMFEGVDSDGKKAVLPSLLGSFLDFKGTRLLRTEDIISKRSKWDLDINFNLDKEKPEYVLSHWGIEHYLPKNPNLPNLQVWKDNCRHITYRRSIRGVDLTTGSGWVKNNPLIISNNPEQFGSGSEKGANEGGFKQSIGKNKGLLFHVSNLETFRSPRQGTLLQGDVEVFLFHFIKTTKKSAPSSVRIYILVEPESFPESGQLQFAIKGHHEIGGFEPQKFSYVVAQKWLAGGLPEKSINIKKSAASPLHILSYIDVPYKKFIEGRYQISPKSKTPYGLYIYASTETNETPETIYKEIRSETRLGAPKSLPLIDGVYASKPSNGSDSFGPPEASHWGRNAGLYPASVWKGELEVKVPLLGHSIGISLNHHGVKVTDSDHVVQQPMYNYVDSKEPSFENYGTCFKAKIKLVNDKIYPTYVSPIFMVYDVENISKISHFYNAPIKVNGQIIPILLTPQERWIYLGHKMKFNSTLKYHTGWNYIKIEPNQTYEFDIEFYVPGLATGNHGVVFETVYTEDARILFGLEN